MAELCFVIENASFKQNEPFLLGGWSQTLLPLGPFAPIFGPILFQFFLLRNQYHI